MPLEGQWDRQHTPLRRLGRREQRLLGLMAVVLAVACALIVVAAISKGSSPATPPSCVEVVGPSTMGASNYQACGRQAARFCAAQADRQDGFADLAREECRRAGYL